MAKQTARDEFEYSVATAPPTRRESQLAFVVVVVTLAAYGAVAPFSGLPLQRYDSFVPAMASLMFLTDLITAVLLFSQFSATGARGLLLLAGGYLFSGLIAIPFALTFPGAFAPTGLLGADSQSAAWLSISIRISLIVATAGYALLIGGKHTQDSLELSSTRPTILWSVAIVIIAACALTWVVTTGHDFMPRLLDGNGVLPLAHYATGVLAAGGILTLLILWFRGNSVLDLWLMVAIFAVIAESLSIALLPTGRFTVSFYANRTLPVAISKVVLIVLLAETLLLQTRLSVANRKLERERENKLMSAEAVVAALAHEVRQPLAGMTSRAAAGRRFLDRAPPDPNIDKAQTLFDQIKDAGFRASEVFHNCRSA